MFVPTPAMRHLLANLKRSATVLTLAIAIALPSCGESSSSPVALAPEMPAITEVNATLLQAEADGSFVLPSPIPASQFAASVQLLVASDDPLPERIEIGSATYLRMPAIAAEGFDAYVPALDSFLKSIEETPTVTIPGVTSARIQLIISDDDGLGDSSRTRGDASTVSLLYKNDPNSVDIADFILVYALTFLPEGQENRTPQKIADLANTLLGAEAFTPSDFSPIPDATNTDWANGGRPTTPNIIDAAVVAAAALLQEQGGGYGAPQIVPYVNVFVPTSGFTEAQLRGVPGLDPLPGSSPTTTPTPGERDTLTLARSPLLATFDFSDNTIFSAESEEIVFADEYILDTSTLSAGQNVQINMNQPPGSEVDPVLTILDGTTGSLIATNDDTIERNAEVTFTIQSGVTYLVRAENYNAFNDLEGVGTYTLQASLAGTLPPTPTPTPTPALPDIVFSQGRVVGTDLLIEVRFAQPIAPASSGAPNAVGGYIELDLDQTDGFFDVESEVGFNLGVEGIIDLYSEQNGLVTAEDTFTGAEFTYPIEFTSDSFSITIPLSTLFLPTGALNYGIYVGLSSNPSSYSDLSPNPGQFLTMPDFQGFSDPLGDTGDF